MPPRPLGNGSMYVMGRRESPGPALLLSVIRAFCFGRAGWAELHSLAVNEQNLHHHPGKAGPPATTQLGRGPGPYISPHASTMSASGGWALLPPWCNGTSKAGPLPGSSFPAPTAGDRNLMQESPARAQLPSALSLQLHHAWLGPLCDQGQLPRLYAGACAPVPSSQEAPLLHHKSLMNSASFWVM